MRFVRYVYMITYSILLQAFTGALCFEVDGHLDGHGEGVTGSTAAPGKMLDGLSVCD